MRKQSEDPVGTGSPCYNAVSLILNLNSDLAHLMKYGHLGFKHIALLVPKIKSLESRIKALWVDLTARYSFEIQISNLEPIQ